MVTTLSAVAAAGAQRAASARDTRPVRDWNSPSRLMRSPVHPSPGGWRRSVLP